MAGAKAPKPSFEGVATSAADEEKSTPKVQAAAKEPARNTSTSAKPKVTVNTTTQEKKPEAAKASKSKATAQPKAAPKATAKRSAAVAVETEPVVDEAPARETSAPAPQKSKLSSAMRNPSGWLQGSFPGHEHAALGGLVGLVLALCVFLVGFWQTLFVSVLVVVGIAVGQYLDGDPKIINFIRRLIAEARGNE